MAHEVRQYDTDELTVFWKQDLCEHAGFCVRGLPKVFEVGRRPWVKLDEATTDEIIEVIDRCPSGALSYKRK